MLTTNSGSSEPGEIQTIAYDNDAWEAPSAAVGEGSMPEILIDNNLVALADILGHTDLNTTRIYTKRRLSDLQEGAERVRFFNTRSSRH